MVQQTTTDYFANSYLKVPFSQDYWQTGTYMFTAGQALARQRPVQLHHVQRPRVQLALHPGPGTNSTQAKRADLIHQMARIDYDRGGYIIPYFFPVIDAASMKVGGITENANGYSPSGNDFADFWLT